jgi:hypothetical protein
MRMHQSDALKKPAWCLARVLYRCDGNVVLRRILIHAVCTSYHILIKNLRTCSSEHSLGRATMLCSRGFFIRPKSDTGSAIISCHRIVRKPVNTDSSLSRLLARKISQMWALFDRSQSHLLLPSFCHPSRRVIPLITFENRIDG